MGRQTQGPAFSLESKKNLDMNLGFGLDLLFADGFSLQTCLIVRGKSESLPFIQCMLR